MSVRGGATNHIKALKLHLIRDQKELSLMYTGENTDEFSKATTLELCVDGCVCVGKLEKKKKSLPSPSLSFPF